MGLVNSMRGSLGVDWSFISFNFDGRDIQDFGVVAALSGDRYQRNMSGNFTHNFETVIGKIGDVYWGTDYGASTLSFSLTTDGMTGNQFKAFKNHFSGNKIGKLILAESPYMYCYARIENTPVFSFLPFESLTTINEIDFLTNEYKGEMSLTFHLSDPRFYSDYALYNTFTNLNAKYWALESGLPISGLMIDGDLYCDSNKKCTVTDSGITLTYTDNIGLTYLTSDDPLPFYNAGDFAADTNTSFTINLGTISDKITFFDTITGENFYFLVGKKSDLSDGKKVNLRAPLVIRDFNRALDLLANYSSTTITPDVKAEMRAIMYTNLEHEKIIEKIISAIANNATYNDMRASFLLFFKNSNINITLDGINRAGTVSFTYNDGTTNGTLITETSSDIMASNYIQIEGTSGLNSDNKIEPSCYISSSRNLSLLKINYLYTYI